MQTEYDNAPHKFSNGVSRTGEPGRKSMFKLERELSQAQSVINTFKNNQKNNYMYAHEFSKFKLLVGFWLVISVFTFMLLIALYTKL